VEKAEQSKMKVESPMIDPTCECFNKAVLREFFLISSDEKCIPLMHASVGEPQKGEDGPGRHYDEERLL
jgi:hypothetical protein